MRPSRSCAKTVEMDGAFYYARYSLGLALELKGAIPEAIAEYQKAIAISEDPVPLGMLGRLYAAQGRKDDAQKILQQLRQRREQHYTAAYSLALVYLGMGDHNEALNWLEKGFQERDGFNIGPIRVDPLLTPLRGDPRFEALAEKIVPLARIPCGIKSEDRQLLRRAEAAQRLQGRGRLHRRRLGAFSGNRAGFSTFRHSQLGNSRNCAAHHPWSARCAGVGVDVRADTAGN